MRKATVGERPRLAAVRARAFYDDPAAQWMLPDGSRRLRMLDASFGLGLRKLWLPHDECYTTDGIVGAAVWEPPGQWHVPIRKQLRLLPAIARIYRLFLPRYVRAVGALESNHPTKRHYYLFFMGVDPECQGRGIGSALIRPILDRCDRERVPAYLEASTPRNRVLYERHGFAVTEEFKLGKGSPPLWRMWREPGEGDS